MGKSPKSAGHAGLRQLRERAGLSVRQTADAIEVPASTYSSYENKYKKPYLPIDLIKKLIPVFGEHGIEANELLILAGISGVFAASSMTQTHNESATFSDTIFELDVRAAGGAGLTHDVQEEPPVAEWMLPRDVLVAQTTASAHELKIIRVYGDSMTPDFNPGERVLVDVSDRAPSPPGVFVLWDGFGLVIKRLEFVLNSDPATVRLISRNREYETYQRPLHDVVINGRVIGKWLWT